MRPSRCFCFYTEPPKAQTMCSGTSMQRRRRPGWDPGAEFSRHHLGCHDWQLWADVEFLNRALDRVFDAAPIDPARIAIGGFSDGATYAIALGLINSDLFKRVAAFSPGFVMDGSAEGKPRFFVSHGTRDRILPIESCGRRVAADLTSRGYEVNFREFDGGHEIPADVMLDGLRWVSRP